MKEEEAVDCCGRASAMPNCVRAPKKRSMARPVRGSVKGSLNCEAEEVGSSSSWAWVVGVEVVRRRRGRAEAARRRRGLRWRRIFGLCSLVLRLRVNMVDEKGR
jgi:hypothetical protein